MGDLLPYLDEKWHPWIQNRGFRAIPSLPYAVWQGPDRAETVQADGSRGSAHFEVLQEGHRDAWGVEYALLAWRNGQLGRLRYRLSGTSLPRGTASLLAALGDGPQPLAKLAEREGLAQPTVTRIVRRLEALDLVRRDSDPADGRIALVSITAAGERSSTTCVRGTPGC
jgi:DNA-binding MarR family transcriptional regulator